MRKHKQIDINLLTETKNAAGSDIHLNYHPQRESQHNYSKTMEIKFSNNMSDYHLSDSSRTKAN